MSGHHPAHTRLPVGNPPPVEHSLGGWNHIGHQAPGVGLLAGALNQHPSLMGTVRNMVPQTAHLGPTAAMHSAHAPWLNKVPGGSHNGDGSGVPPNTPTNPPPANPPTNQLFMQLLANQDRRVAAAVAGYCGTNPYQPDMIDLSRPGLERTEPLPLVTGNPAATQPNVERESYVDVRNGSATSDSTNPFNGEVNSEKRAATVSVIAANPSREKSVENKVARVEGSTCPVVKEPVRPAEGNPADVINKTDNDRIKAPTSHLKVAPVQTLVSHNKKAKSVEAIVENLFELGSKKQEADSTNAFVSQSDNMSPSQNSNKPIPAQTVPKTDSTTSDPHSESEDGDGKMRRKRKTDTPTRKSMSPPPVKKPLIPEQVHQPLTVSPEKSEMPSQLGLAAFKSSQSSFPQTPVGSQSPTVSTMNSPTSETNTPSTTWTPTNGSGGNSSTVSDTTVKSEISTSVSNVSALFEAEPLTSTSVSVVKNESILPETSPTTQQQPVSSSPILTTSSSIPIDSSQKDDVKNAFVEVESKMEALFAGIIGSGDEGIPGPSESFGGENPLTPFNESLDLDTTSNIAEVLEAKPSTGKKGRPKGSRNGIRQSSDSIFGTSSTESSPQKGKKQKKKLLKDIFDESPGKKQKKSVAAVVKNKAKFQKEPSQQTCDSGSTASSVRIKGPVVHCVGPRENPHQVAIINAPPREDEDQEKPRRLPTGRRKVAQIEGKVTSWGLCSSSLVSRSEAQSPDVRTWVCVFCKRGPHLNGAGDLFGPYLIDESEASTEVDLADKKKGKQSVSSPPGSQMGMLTVAPSGVEKPHFIVWSHEDCVVWASGVHLVGVRLAGLDEAVWAALNTKCHRCRNWGANVGCLRHGCAQRAHYPCAVESGWHLDEELFKSTCNVHRV